MRCLRCVVLALLCLISSASAGAAQPTPAAYYWDLNDREIVSVSSGTGGTASRADEPPAFDLYAYYDPFWYWERSEMPQCLSHVMEDADARRFVTEWVGRIGRELWGEAIPYDDLDYFDYAFIGNLLQCTAEKDGCIRMAVFDLVQKRELALSDFFYDGFNYIDYINRTIASYPREQYELAYYYGDDYIVYPDFGPQEREVDISLSEAGFDTVYAKRPFSGLPRDYPLFAWMPGSLVLYFEEYNPFWTPEPGLDIPTFLVPLTEDISPWPMDTGFSGFWPESLPIRLRYERVETGRGQTLILSLFDQLGDAPAPEALNAALLETFARAAKTVDWDTAPIRQGWPFYRQDEQIGDYISVAFMDWYENSYYDLPYDEHIIVYGADIYSLKTGEALDLSTLYATARRRPETVYYPESSLDTLEENHDYDYFGPDPTPIPDIKEYHAPEAVAALDAWLIWHWDEETEEFSDWVVLRFETPDGERMRLVAPFEVVERMEAK